MIAGAGVRRLLLFVHVATSVGLAGAAVSFLTLALAGLTSLAGASPYAAMETLTIYLIVPLALAALAIGVLQSALTHWGLVRHWWVAIKLLLTSFATVVLLLQVGTIRTLATLSPAALDLPDARSARVAMVVHATGGVIVLLIALALSVWKPRGLTRHGWRKHAETLQAAGTGR